MGPSGNAITWPFQCKNWPVSLWILLLGWIPLFGWIFALTTSTGWMVDAIGRLGRSETDPLPPSRHIVGMFFCGILYWLMLFLYLVAPIWLLGLVFAAETAIIVEQFHHWALASFENLAVTAVNVGAIEFGSAAHFDLLPQEDLLSLVERWATVYTAGFVFPVIWVVYAVPVFFAATIRFAVTGRLGSYFRPLANTGFVLRHIFGFLWLVLVIVVLNLLFGMVPFPGLYLAVTLSVWIVAYYAGRLGTKLHVESAPAAVRAATI